MKKVKIFTDYSSHHLETQINEWIAASQTRSQQKVTIESVTLSAIGQPSPIKPLPDMHYCQLFATVIYKQKKAGKKKA